ncbi:MAG: potassium channel protein [Synechococcales cyanobacterium CRU_2_2]|nr:potassium channel protein [Synechococcales cyanobacterium CRU_2_2]
MEPRERQVRRELIAAALLFLGVLFIGTVGYRLLERWSLLDSAYMTIITLSSVGFGEVQPLSPQGRLFTITLILMGLLSIGYIVNRFTDAVVQGYFQDSLRSRRRRRVIKKLRNHYILCGYGRAGRQVAFEFAEERIPFIVVDSEPEAIQEAKQFGYLTFLGDATRDQTLLEVGIHDSRCIVAAMPSDADNLYTVLSAKALKPDLRTIARANSEEAVVKMQRAGADAVISPYITGGKRMAAAALRPQVMDFVDGVVTGSDRSFYMEEIIIHPGDCPYVGQSLRDTNMRAKTDALIIAIRRGDGTLVPGPTGETQLMDGDLLICMGTTEALRALLKILIPLSPEGPRLPRH